MHAVFWVVVVMNAGDAAQPPGRLPALLPVCMRLFSAAWSVCSMLLGLAELSTLARAYLRVCSLTDYVSCV